MQYEMPALSEEQREQLIEFIRGEQELWTMEGHYSTVLRIALTALASQTGSAPDGWQLVPVEPTRQMMSQGHFAMAGTDRGKFRRIYQAMVAAAPEAPCLSASSS